MADIIIRGMEMPKDGCKSCAFDILGLCLIKANMDKPHEVTHSCPLVELPEHGRLIDADALKETLDYYIREAGWGDEVNMALEWVKEFIDSEGTIIPAFV